MRGDLTDRIKRYALEALGFDLVGVAAAAPLPGASRLRAWIGSGFHGEMAYMADTVEVRADPGRFLPGARSVVCVAMSYHDAPEPPELEPCGDRVVVARYARRSDYHKVIKRRLVRLGRRLREMTDGARWRIGVDEHPLLERELAERAGLGWIGRNTCLINRRLGSEVLLGALVTDVELVPEVPDTDHCGRCTACLSACPTAALTRDRGLDARRCISAITIEQRRAIPDELHGAIGGHLFGCDICQSVCPWNRRARCGPAAPLRQRPALAVLELGSLRRLDAVGWSSLSAGTPLRRLSFERFTRNLSVVAGNLHPSDDLDE